MKYSNFIDWLNGFLTDKTQLDGQGVSTLKAKLKEVENNSPIDLNDLVIRDITPMPNPPINPFIEPIGTSGCAYPFSCGMPSVWYGVTPPVCTKCNLGGQTPTVTCDTNNLNVNYEVISDNSHITGDLNESQD